MHLMKHQVLCKKVFGDKFTVVNYIILIPILELRSETLLIIKDFDFSLMVKTVLCQDARNWREKI